MNTPTRGAWGDFELTCPSEGKGKPCIPNRYTFTAREWDPDAQLYYYRARWYDRETKRFTGEDPQYSFNKYCFTMNTPINSKDFTGERALTKREREKRFSNPFSEMS